MNRFSEPAFRSVRELVPVLAEALEPLLDLPSAFYGHSMGSIIAFELMHELRERGLMQPLALFAGAHQAPTIPHEGVISALPEAEVIAYVKRMSNTPQLLEHPELLRLMLPTLRCDLSLCDTYAYTRRRKLTCAITAFGGDGDTVSDAELEAWGEETEGAFDVEKLPGGHFFLSHSRAALLETLSRRLRVLVD